MLVTEPSSPRPPSGAPSASRLRKASADHHGRQHERHGDQRAQHGPPAESAFVQQVGAGHAERDREHRGRGGLHDGEQQDPGEPRAAEDVRHAGQVEAAVGAGEPAAEQVSTG